MSQNFVSLGEIAQFINGDRGKNYPAKGSFVDEGVAFINAGSLSQEHSIDSCSLNYITEAKYDSLSSGKVAQGDILFCLRGSIGKFALITEQMTGAIASSLVIVRPSEKVFTGYLKHYFASNLCRREIDNFENGAAQPNLSATDLKEFRIPLPPLVEQKRIAAILDKADAIRQKRKQAIDLADEFLRSVFLDMFGDPVTNPKGWDLKPIVEGVNKITSGWSAKGESRPCENHELGVLKISAVTSGKFKPEENKFVDKGIIPTEKKLICPLKGDLLFSRANTRELVGATCIVPFDSLNTFLPDKLWKVELDSTRLLPEYLHMLLRHEKFRETLTSKATGSSGSMLNISKQKFESTIAPFSSVELQNKFAVLYWKLVHELDLKESSLEKLEQQFKALSQKAFAGEL
ncbi:restriction endonuclease subunit S [Vibrio sp. 1F255]|uniref:restriction endonuclease subunit S n=1 Tax=Vibrio sp. 1F255 TaxID=3230009 RepID=UPI00352DA396